MASQNPPAASGVGSPNWKGESASFRDPAGFVFHTPDGVRRAIRPAGMSDYQLLLDSGLYDELSGSGALVPARDVDCSAEYLDSLGAERVIAPDEIPFLSYPYEWCFEQLKDAALLTLAIQAKAVRRGMSLKDASAYNVQFWGSTPKFIDTLSFEPYEVGSPWKAYRQFCKHFLAPLVVASKLQVPLQSSLVAYLDGMPLTAASRMLPLSTRFSPGVAVHLHWHSKLEDRHSSLEEGRPKKAGPKVSQTGLLGLLDSLRKLIERLKPPSRDTAWSSYYKDNSYDEESIEQKQEFVVNAARRLNVQSAWDIGCNTGRFSQALFDEGVNVVAADSDEGAIGVLYTRLSEAGNESILPMVIDASNPSPSIGWRNEERRSFLHRGPTELSLGLAVIHHLAISNNVPMPEVARFFASLSARSVVEWVPTDDPQVRRMLSSGRDLPDDYNRESFIRCIGEVFTEIDSVKLPSGRELFLLEA